MSETVDGLKAAEIGEEERRKIEALVEQEEGAAHKFGGWWGWAIAGLAALMSVFHLYAAYATVPQQEMREVHLAFALVLIFLLYPISKGWRNRIAIWDLAFAAISVWTVWHMMAGGDDFLDRAYSPDTIDLVAGSLMILLILEATRRTTGLIMPALAGAFWLYGLYGAKLPTPWDHRGYSFSELVAEMYMTLNGIFGTALDVSASVIILFTIFGAVLQASGAGKFFIDFSMRAMRKQPNAAGRSVVLSSFLLGGPSGSGVATTVTIGSVAWPIMRNSGYAATAAGGLLAAGGLGAILSPPVLGAAAFLIAENLRISYLEIVRMALVPTCLYYFGLLIMTDIDARKYGLATREADAGGTLWDITRAHGYHFTSLISIVVLMAWGFSSTYAVFWSILLAIGVSYLRRDTALMPIPLLRALESGAVQALNIAATCACAGIVVGIITKTGLAVKFSSIVIDLAHGNLILTAIYTAMIVWIVGLAVPVTASYIMCAVIAAPALVKVGVPDFAAHMFIFYYAVLSEVSPPTALSPFAAAALTRSDPYLTTLQSWKYALPAFLVPFVFVVDPQGISLLLQTSKTVGWDTVIWVSLTTAAGIVALSAATQRYLLKPLGIVEWIVCAAAGIVITFPDFIDQFVGGAHIGRIIGMAVVLAILGRQWLMRPARR